MSSTKKLFERLNGVFLKSLDEIAFTQNRKITHEEKLKRIDFDSLKDNPQAKTYTPGLMPLDTTFGLGIKDIYDYRKGGKKGDVKREIIVGGQRIVLDKKDSYDDFIKNQYIPKEGSLDMLGVTRRLTDSKEETEKLTPEEIEKRKKENKRGMALHKAFRETDLEIYKNVVEPFLQSVTNIDFLLYTKKYYQVSKVYLFLIKFCFFMILMITDQSNNFIVEGTGGMVKFNFMAATRRSSRKEQVVDKNVNQSGIEDIINTIEDYTDSDDKILKTNAISIFRKLSRMTDEYSQTKLPEDLILLKYVIFEVLPRNLRLLPVDFLGGGYKERENEVKLKMILDPRLSNERRIIDMSIQAFSNRDAVIKPPIDYNRNYIENNSGISLVELGRRIFGNRYTSNNNDYIHRKDFIENLGVLIKQYQKTKNDEQKPLGRKKSVSFQSPEDTLKIGIRNLMNEYKNDEDRGDILGSIGNNYLKVTGNYSDDKIIEKFIEKMNEDGYINDNNSQIKSALKK